MTKLKYSLFGALALIFIFQTTACKSAKDTMDAEATTAKDVVEEQKEASKGLSNNLLWKISGNGLEKSSFLYGTIHMIGAEDFFLPDGTMTAMDASDRVVFEIDMADMTDMSSMMGLMDKAFMKDNLTLQDLLTEEDFKLVEDHFKDMGLPIFFMQRIKPMFLTVFTSGDMSPGDLQSGKIKSYEFEFMEMAKNGEKPTAGLETIDFQLSVFDSIPYADQAEMLMDGIKNGGSDSDSFKEIVEVYKEQNLTKMLAMTLSEDGGLAEYDDLLLNQRNKNWIPQMKTMMAENVNFFAVGAGHLPGDEGVINLLREAGYTVEPFTSKGI